MNHMIPRETIQKILEAGVRAPSGGNSQPWRFLVAGDAVSVFMVPGKDHPILNVNNWGTLLAIGALLENISVAALHYGFEAAMNFFPEPANRTFVAKVSFRDAKGGGPSAMAGASGQELFDAIWKRATNRKPYGTEKIDGAIRQALLAAPAEVGAYDTVLKLIDDRGQIGTLAIAASANEIIMFENRALHKLFFSELVWTEREEKEKKSGLYLKTLELKPPQASAMKALRSWPMMRFANLFGMARKIARENAAVYAACSFYGGVLCGTADADLVRAGQVAERAWLRGTALGLSFHLQIGVNFLWARLHSPGGERIFSRAQAALIDEQYSKVVNVFQAEGKFVPAIFRIGYGGEPSARSSRKAPEATWENS